MISYIVWNVDPHLIDGVEFLRWYGLSWAVGTMLAYQLLSYVFKKEMVPQEDLDKLATYVMLGGIIGARLGHIIFYSPEYYMENPIEILPIRLNPTFQFTGLAGLASHGGYTGAAIALYIYHRKYSKGYFWLLDRVAIGAILLGGCIRLGNLMNSEIIGKPTTVSWAFVFEQVDLVPRHPAQLYEAIFYFLISFILCRVWRSGRMREYTGFIFGLGLTLSFVQRFFVEFVKENQVQFEEGLWINMGQILSLPLIICGFVIIYWSLRQRDKEKDPTVVADEVS